MARQETLEEEIRNVLAPNQESKILLNEFDRIWFSGVNKTKKGLHFPSLKKKPKTISIIWHTSIAL